MKKFFAILLAVVMLLAIGVTALADDDDGSITISNAAIGKEYVAYQILDATLGANDAIAYTTTTPAIFEGSPFTVAATADANGNYAVTIADGTTAATITAWIASNISKFTAISATSGTTNDLATATTVKWTGLPYGYYYVTSSLGSEVMLDSVNKTAEIIDKNPNEPVPPAGGNLKEDDETTAQIGDDVHFTVTFIAVNFYVEEGAQTMDDVTPIEKYLIADTPDGYDIDKTTLKVTVDGEEVTIEDAAVNADGVLTFSIPWAGKGYADAAEVVITYTGTVNADAVDGKAENSVVITTDPGTVTLTGTTDTTNYNLTINKTDGTDPLEGAQFELYRGDATDPLSLVELNGPISGPAADGTVYYRIAYTGETGTTTIDMSTASSAVIYGLDGADTYNVLETAAPGGYNKLEGKTAVAMSNANQTQPVVNQKGVELPSTGGSGVYVFYILGGILVAAACVLLVVRKRMSREN